MDLKTNLPNGTKHRFNGMRPDDGHCLQVTLLTESTKCRPCMVPRCIAPGRLNQWAHWARAQGPRIFFFLRGPELAVVK